MMVERLSTDDAETILSRSASKRRQPEKLGCRAVLGCMIVDSMTFEGQCNKTVGSKKEERKKNLFATNNNGIKQEKQRNNTEVSS